MQMTSRQRVMAAISHKEPDRVPLFPFSVDAKFIKTWGQGNVLKTYEIMGLDTFPIRVQNWCGDMPAMASLIMEVPEGYQTAGGAFGGWDGIDEFGRVWKRGSYVGGDLKGRADISKYIPPLMLEERTPPDLLEKCKNMYPDKAFCMNSHTGPFGLTMESMGFDHFFYSLYDERDLVKEVIEQRTHWFIAIAQYLQELGVDFIVMGDDVAYKGKTFVSPEDFSELAIPYYKMIAEALDIPLFWHSDGFIEPLIPMAIDAGIKGLHAIEPVAGNDMGRIKKKYGDQLGLMGNVDCVNVLTSTDLELVRRDVDRCMRQAKSGGGYMLASSNSLHASCTLEAVEEMYRYGGQVGVY